MEDHKKNLGYWVKRFYLLSVQEMDSMLAPYDLGRTQWYILYHVNAHGQLPQRELQSILSIESATLTPLIAALVKKGWLTQQPSPDDRRTKILALTKAGVRHYDMVPNPINQGWKKALAGIDNKDVKRARKVLEQAVSNLEKGLVNRAEG